MKNKRLIALIAAIALLGLGLWYVYPSSEPLVVQQIEKPVSKAVERKPTIVEELNKIENQASPEVKEIAAKVLEKVVQSNKKLSTISKIQQAQNMPIEFYGKVIDQHGEPVSGVKVHYTIAAYEGIISSGPVVRNYWVDTDSNGAFSVTGKRGERIGIRDREKYGYEFEKTSPYYEMSKQWVGHKLKSRGSPDKPVIFKAWKKTEAEPLVYNDILIGFSPDGKTYAVDLIKPKKTEGGSVGDIKVTFNRPLDARRNEQFDWDVTVEAIGGGLIETTDVFMNEAPEFGYQSVWKLEMKKNSPNYQSEMTRKFYLKSRNGEVYGRLEFEFIPIYNDNSDIDAKWWLNPNGSRNLQYDPAKRIYPK